MKLRRIIFLVILVFLLWDFVSCCRSCVAPLGSDYWKDSAVSDRIPAMSFQESEPEQEQEPGSEPGSEPSSEPETTPSSEPEPGVEPKPGSEPGSEPETTPGSEPELAWTGEEFLLEGEGLSSALTNLPFTGRFMAVEFTVNSIARECTGPVKVQYILEVGTSPTSWVLLGTPASKNEVWWFWPAELELSISSVPDSELIQVLHLNQLVAEFQLEPVTTP